MKTVVERNNRNLYNGSDHRPKKASNVSSVIPSPFPEHSCFYDYGAKNPVEFRGFVNSGNSAFINEIGKAFDFD